jgi:hypothetical protein
LVGGGDPEVLLAAAVSEAVARDVALPDGSGAEPADGEGDDARPGGRPDGDGLVVPRAVARAAPPSCDVARGAAHSANGAVGPPAIATTMAPRQMASAAADTKPIRRMARRRRPDGSANTGLECTARSVATLVTANPGFAGPVHHETAPGSMAHRGRLERDQWHIDPPKLLRPGD